ncbi:palmitoyltransferase ZDHHC1 [Thrips palmi]|uniref:Palmitoyltransferase n=1 Tax=Thrips palmi TaxID=161013 RepID=A0A6P9A4S2_THRPL|nr:palmitoyltransferase ZDHHC1 [Thrips palmi]
MRAGPRAIVAVEEEDAADEEPQPPRRPPRTSNQKRPPPRVAANPSQQPAKQQAAPTVPTPCCSFQTSLGPPEYRKWRRLHGLQLPLHPQQVAGWVTLAAFTAATFLVLVPALGPELRPSVMPVLACLFAVHAGSHLAAVLLDPADAPLRRLRVRTAVPEFDRTKHAHVIEHGRCHLCNIATTGPRTKHCSVCNKCVGRFDHHCKWLNHCVGGRNYAAFLVCVVSAVLTALVVVGVAVAELVLYHVNPHWLSPWTYVPYNRTVGSVPSDAHFPFQDTAFLCVVSALGVLAAVSAGLLLHLCLFHVYISLLGITTYEYIRRYRSLAAAAAAAVKAPKTVSKQGGSVRGSRSASELSFRTGGYQQPEVTEYTGCECNPGRIPVGPPPPRHRPPPRQPPRQRAAAAQSSSFLSRLCASFSAPGPRAGGAAYPPGVGVRRNQVRPTAESPQARLMGSRPGSRPGSAGSTGKSSRHNSGKRHSDDRPRRPSSGDSNKYSPLPALPVPSRRRLQGVSLKELGDVLAYAQDPKQQPQPAQPPQPQPRRPTPQPARPKSPTLSPIHESGLSNPSTPQRPRTARQTPDSDSPPGAGHEAIPSSDPEDPDDDEYAHSIMYIDEDEGTYFTASMSSMSSAMTPLTPLTPLTPMSTGFSAASWAASKEARAPASAL